MRFKTLHAAPKPTKPAIEKHLNRAKKGWESYYKQEPEHKAQDLKPI